MTDKIVTYEDLDSLRVMRDDVLNGWPSLHPLLDRLIAAAEADQPPLPEGWVVERHPDGTSRIVMHKDGVTSMWSDGTYETVIGPGSRLTPLRPTFTEADVEKAARAARAAYLNEDAWDVVHRNARDVWKKNVRATLDALGIEVSG